MKNCDYFKDLILTDYIDGELDKDGSGNLESHLLDCADCRVFFKEVRNNTTMPFQQSGSQPVPAELWSAVKQGIEHKNQAASPVVDFIDQLKGLFVFPRLVPIFASLTLMFIVGSVTLNNYKIDQAKDNERGEYLVALLSPAAASTASENNDLGTPIERYFL